MVGSEVGLVGGGGLAGMAQVTAELWQCLAPSLLSIRLVTSVHCVTPLTAAVSAAHTNDQLMFSLKHNQNS